MAEFCPDCFKKLCHGWIITKVSKKEELCEGCDKWKVVVIEAEPVVKQ